jgi:transcriptional regulator with XRE-family HTH domain
MNLNDKIKQILIDKNISPSYFADEIGVQRSSVSHILSGRNKPSLDIVQKIIRRFPEFGMDWILDEEEIPTPRREKAPISAVKEDLFDMEDEAPAVAEPIKATVEPASSPVSTMLHQNKNEVSGDKRIERILIFYSDGTFQEFK